MNAAEKDAIQLLYCSCPDADCAGRIARRLVEDGLAACVNILPGLRSVYRWKGVVQDEPECLLLIKTRASRFDAVASAIRALHPYELPELIAVPVAAGLPAYLDWVRDNS